jgi:hypothetical protein
MFDFSYTEKPTDLNIQRPVGEYKVSITEVEIKTSKAGNEYLALKMEGKTPEGIESTFFQNFFPKSANDFPKKFFANFLTCLGYYRDGKIVFNDINELKDKTFIAIAQKVESEYQGEVSTRLEIHSFYNLAYKSAGEIADNVESKSFKSNLEYVQENPLKALKKSAETTGDLPF